MAVAMFAVVIIVPAASTMVRQASLETVVRFFISWLPMLVLVADISHAPLSRAFW